MRDEEESAVMGDAKKTTGRERESVGVRDSDTREMKERRRWTGRCGRDGGRREFI